ncbi:MAG: transglutaminase domain-containing protein [Spirochaetaceae bacterium]
MSPTRSHARSAMGATVVFLILLSAFYALISFTGRRPVIEDVQPRATAPGEQIEIIGEHFGDNRGRGRIRIAGSTGTSSAYLEWSDERIVMRVPEDADSGLVYVETERGRSNGVLFANADHVPTGYAADDSAARPALESIDPETVSVGDVVTIRGERFGLNRNDSRVTFAWESEDGEAGRVEVTEDEDGYVYWSTREVRVRVPDGAVSGPVSIETVRGESSGMEVTVERPVGRKRFSGRRSHAVAVSVSVDSVQLAGDAEEATLFLWAPTVARAPEQRNHQTLTETDVPLFTRTPGVSLHRIRNPAPDTTWSMRRTALFDRYAVETDIESDAVPLNYDRSAEFVRRYTEADELLPVNDEAIRAEAARLRRVARSPYVRARRTYERVLEVLSPVARVGVVPPVEALQEGSANAYGYAALTVSLLRAQEIPARLVAGYLVCGSEAVERHYWAEFYIERFGWVPLDPAAADGAVCEDFAMPEDPVSFYFGNTDADRITFSKGLIEVPRMHPEGRTRRVETMYSLQTHHQEAVGDISWYRVRWHDVTYLGDY